VPREHVEDRGRTSLIGTAGQVQDLVKDEASHRRDERERARGRTTMHAVVGGDERGTDALLQPAAEASHRGDKPPDAAQSFEPNIDMPVADKAHEALDRKDPNISSDTLWQAADKDENGVLDRGEFRRFLRDRKDVLKLLLNRKSGLTDNAADQRIINLFLKMDQDGSGTISKDEWMNAYSMIARTQEPTPHEYEDPRLRYDDHQFTCGS